MPWCWCHKDLRALAYLSIFHTIIVVLIVTVIATIGASSLRAVVLSEGAGFERNLGKSWGKPCVPQ